MCPSGLANDKPRQIKITRSDTKHAEGVIFKRDKLNSMLALAESGIGDLIKFQRETLEG